MHRLKAILIAIGAVMTLVGAAGVFLPSVLRTAFEDTTIEPLLPEVSDIAVSPNGDVFFAMMNARRIQRFSGAGTFVNGFPVGTWGLFCIAIADRTLEVHVARGDTTFVYDLEGRLLGTRLWDFGDRTSFPCKRDRLVASITVTWRDVQVRFTDHRPPLTIKRRAWDLLVPPLLSWLTLVAGLMLMAVCSDTVRRIIVQMTKEDRSQPGWRLGPSRIDRRERR